RAARRSKESMYSSSRPSHSHFQTPDHKETDEMQLHSYIIEQLAKADSLDLEHETVANRAIADRPDRRPHPLRDAVHRFMLACRAKLNDPSTRIWAQCSVPRARPAPW